MIHFSTEHFQKHKFTYELFALASYFSINASINATTVLMEEARKTSSTFQAWEPFVWEFSSALATLLLFPLIAWSMRHYPWNWQATKTSLMRYSGIALAYACAHVFLMVMFREAVYTMSESDYQFADTFQQFMFEGFYELRKDLWSFCFFVAMISIYRYLIAQWFGDTKSLAVDQKSEHANTSSSNSHFKQHASNSLANRLLVKKLGKEFLIKSKDIEWVEACGNYVNLHINDAIYPMRMTMSEFVSRSAAFGIARIHKSFAVNINAVSFIETLSSGDAEIVMLSGKKLRLSRRYKTEFEGLVASESY